MVGHGDRAVRVALDLSGTIDVGKERARLTKARDVAANEVLLAEAKLANRRVHRQGAPAGDRQDAGPPARRAGPRLTGYADNSTSYRRREHLAAG